MKMPSAYDRWVLECSLSSNVSPIFASRAAGNGIRLSKLEAVALASHVEVEPAHRAHWVRAICRDQVSHLAIGDRVIVDVAEREAIVLAEIDKFRENRLPKLVELGIVTAA